MVPFSSLNGPYTVNTTRPSGYCDDNAAAESSASPKEAAEGAAGPR